MKPQIVALSIAVACAGCQSLPFVPAEDVLLREDAAKFCSIILVSRSDTLTEGTAAQIADHNFSCRCEFPELRPSGWSAAACPGTDQE
jgi:hypothetical protein